MRAIPGCAKRGDQFERAAHGRLANWLLARREPAPATFGHVEQRSRSRRRRLFSTFKVPLLRGRTFNERDTKDSPRVIIIDQAMAEQYFPGEDPIGKRLGVDVGNDEEGWVMSEIVGVVARMRFHAVDEMAPIPVIYCSVGAGAANEPHAFRQIDNGARCRSSARFVRPSTSIDSSLTGVRCASDDGSRARNLGNATSVKFSLFGFRRACFVASRQSVFMDCSLTPRSNASVKSVFDSRLARARPRFARSFFLTACNCS